MNNAEAGQKLAKFKLDTPENRKTLIDSGDYALAVLECLMVLNKVGTLSQDTFDTLIKDKEHAKNFRDALLPASEPAPAVVSNPKILKEAEIHDQQNADAGIADRKYAHRTLSMSYCNAAGIARLDACAILGALSEHEESINKCLLAMKYKNIITEDNLKLLVRAKLHTKALASAFVSLNCLNILDQDTFNILIAAEDKAEVVAERIISQHKTKELTQFASFFIAAMGIAAVAVAFIVLNAATFGIAGVVVAGIGIAAILAGAGLFATTTRANRNDAAAVEALCLDPKTQGCPI